MFEPVLTSTSDRAWQAVLLLGVLAVLVCCAGVVAETFVGVGLVGSAEVVALGASDESAPPGQAIGLPQEPEVIGHASRWR